MPLYERIKAHIYLQYEQALMLFYSVNADLARGRYPRDEPGFISAVLRLYVTLAPKLNYPGKTRKDYYESLRNLEYFLEKPAELTLTDAKVYFRLMRDLLEDLGITKIESRKRTTAQEIMDGITET